MPKLPGHAHCTGCGACYSICHQKAIRKEIDYYGFIHPVIDGNKCISCGACERICPINKDIVGHFPQKVFAASAADTCISEKSTSGGIGFLLSLKCMENESHIIGAVSVFGSQYCVNHEIINHENLHLLRGSKYAQSDVWAVYSEIEKFIHNKESVVFFGTPCQVAGVRSRFGDDERLTCIEVLCHGVPSQKMLTEHISCMTKGQSIVSISFREKEKYKFRIETQSGELFENSHREDTYLVAFLKNVSLRSSCYNCMFTQKKRVADISLGDFWGYSPQEHSELKGKKISCVLINSDKGSCLFGSIFDSLVIEDSSFNQVSLGNPQLCHPASKPLAQRVFRLLYKSLPFDVSIRLSLMATLFKYQLAKIFGI